MNNEELVMDVTEELIDIPVEVEDSTELMDIDQEKTEIGGAEMAIIAAAAAGVVATGVVLVKGGKKVVNWAKGKLAARKANKQLEEEGDLEKIDILEEEVDEADNKGKKRK